MHCLGRELHMLIGQWHQWDDERRARWLGHVAKEIRAGLRSGWAPSEAETAGALCLKLREDPRDAEAEVALLELLEHFAHLWAPLPPGASPEEVRELVRRIRAGRTDIGPVLSGEWAESLHGGPTSGTVRS